MAKGHSPIAHGVVRALPAAAPVGRKRLLFAAVPLVLALASAGCAGAVRDESGVVTTAGNESAFELEPGDCLADPAELADEPDMFEVNSVRVVPCSEPHDSEVYALRDMQNGEYPGDEEVSLAADEACYDSFARFVGKRYEESELDFWFLMPTRASWNELDDREIACLIGAIPGEQTRGSLKGSAR